MINIDEYKSIGILWIAFWINRDNGRASYDATYFDSYGDEHIRKEIKHFMENKNIITNVYRIQA